MPCSECKTVGAPAGALHLLAEIVGPAPASIQAAARQSSARCIFAMSSGRCLPRLPCLSPKKTRRNLTGSRASCQVLLPQPSARCTASVRHPARVRTRRSGTPSRPDRCRMISRTSGVNFDPALGVAYLLPCLKHPPLLPRRLPPRLPRTQAVRRKPNDFLSAVAGGSPRCPFCYTSILAPALRRQNLPPCRRRRCAILRASRSPPPTASWPPPARPLPASDIPYSLPTPLYGGSISTRTGGFRADRVCCRTVGVRPDCQPRFRMMTLYSRSARAWNHGSKPVAGERHRAGRRAAPAGASGSPASSRCGCTPDPATHVPIQPGILQGAAGGGTDCTFAPPCPIVLLSTWYPVRRVQVVSSCRMGGYSAPAHTIGDFFDVPVVIPCARRHICPTAAEHASLPPESGRACRCAGRMTRRLPPVSCSGMPRYV